MLGNKSNVTPQEQCHPEAKHGSLRLQYIGHVAQLTRQHLYNAYHTFVTVTLVFLMKKLGCASITF